MDYQAHYNRLIINAACAPREKGDGVYYEEHHTLPRATYPEFAKDKDNLVLLTAREHFIAHWLLHKINPECHKMARAFWAMALMDSSRHRYVPTSYAYEAARKAHVETLNKPVITPEGRYGSASEAGKAYGISASSATGRCRLGIQGWHYEGEEPVEWFSSRRAVITPEGQYESAAAAGRAYGITKEGAALRAHAGTAGWHWEGEEPKEPKIRTRAVITPQGEFKSAKEAAEAYKIAYSSAVSRAVRRTHGWHYYDEEPKEWEPSKNKAVHTPQGFFETLQEAADHYKISRVAAKQRANKKACGWHYDGEEPGEPPKKRGGTLITPHGTFKSVREASEELSINRNKIRKLLATNPEEWYYQK